jgi:type VI secretion system protein ImpK
MQKDDPFGLFGDGDRTVVLRPQPGGHAPQAMATPGPGQPIDLAQAQAAARNPLVRAAGPILTLAPHLKAPNPPGDIETVRDRVIEQLRRFESEASAAGVERQTVRLSGWALAALIDDIVLNTPWGGHGGWWTNSLVGTLFHEVNAGERFFERLEALEREPQRNRDLLELMYLCLALGFEGRYRVQERAGASLAEVRENLYRLLTVSGPPAERALSPHWRGVAAAHRPLAAAVPLWVVGAATLALLALIYTGFSFRLAAYSDELAAWLPTLPPEGRVALVRTARPEPPVPTPPPRLVDVLRPGFEEILAPDIQRDLVAVDEDAQRVLVRIRDRGLFGSGRAEVQRDFMPVLQRVARALDQEPGRVLVIGHSDNVPIRTPRFPSNWELSEARAGSVASVLRPLLSDPDRIAIDSRAETEPIASNDSAEGRALNRRIDVTLFKQ